LWIAPRLGSLSLAFRMIAFEPSVSSRPVVCFICGLAICFLSGCGSPLEEASGVPSQGAEMPSVTRTEKIEGFDPEGDPELRLLSDGSLELVFEFMPPSFVPETEDEDLGRFEDFDQRLAEAIETEVLWEDREVFLIPAPNPDTVDRLRKFLREEVER
jgi:hypothetical protein